MVRTVLESLQRIAARSLPSSSLSAFSRTRFPRFSLLRIVSERLTSEELSVLKERKISLGSDIDLQQYRDHPQFYILEKYKSIFDSINSINDINILLLNAENGDFVVAVLFIEYAAKPLRRGKLQLFRARGVARDGQKVKLTWYNANYVAKIVHVGAFVRVYGKLKKEGIVSELINPTAELAVETKGCGIKPVYRLKGLIGQNVFREAVRDALDKGYTLKSLVPESGE